MSGLSEPVVRRRPIKKYKFASHNFYRWGISNKNLRAERLERKNRRRAEDGLPPKKTYAEI